jgi:hypothetical protein
VIHIRAARPGSGRPSAYRSEKAASLRSYFQCAAKRVQEMIAAGHLENVPFPTIASWSRKEGLERRAAYRWAKFNDFNAALEYARQVQRDLNLLAIGKGVKFALKESET